MPDHGYTYQDYELIVAAMAMIAAAEERLSELAKDTPARNVEGLNEVYEVLERERNIILGNGMGRPWGVIEALGS